MNNTYNNLTNLLNNIEETDNIEETNLTYNNIINYINFPLIISVITIFQIFFKKNNLSILPNYVNDKLHNSQYSSLIKFLLIIFICLIFTKNITISLVSTTIILIILYLINNKLKK